MAKLMITKSTTSKLIEVFIQDYSITTGGGLTGLVYNSLGLTAYYYREGSAVSTGLSLANMTLGTWVSGGFKEIDATNMPGWYQVGLPNAAITTGASDVVIHLSGAENMAPCPIEIQLINPNYDSSTFGLGTLDANIVTWLGAAPAALTSNGYVQSMLLRWLTDNAGGTPDALSSGKLPADVKLWLTAAPAALSTSGYIKTILFRWLTDDGAGTPAALVDNLVQTDIVEAGGTPITAGDFVDTINTMAVRIAHIPEGLEKNVAYNNFMFIMRSSINHVDPTPGLTVAAQRSIDGAAFATCTNSPATGVSGGDGSYKINLSAADLNGDSIMFYFTAIGADPTFIVVKTV